MNALELLRGLDEEVRRGLEAARDGDEGARDGLVAHLREHCSLQEEHLFPKIEENAAAADVLDDLYRDHEIIIDVLLELERSPVHSPELVALIDELEEVLEAHFAVEEADVYSYIEGAWPPALLEEIGAAMERRPKPPAA